jgi:hypothetical protein
MQSPGTGSVWGCAPVTVNQPILPAIDVSAAHSEG